MVDTISKSDVIAVVQARVNSTRLPEKVLKNILGKPVIQLQLERLERVGRCDGLLVATSDERSDDELEKLCGMLGVECYRGSLDDVLDRFYRAILPHKPEYVVRLTGDCPLADPQLIDEVIEYCIEGDFDYASNTIEPTYPDGLDVEVFKFSVLEEVWKEARLPSEREHVTPFIYNHPEIFRVGSYKGNIDLSHLRWTVDESEDFELVRSIYEELYPPNPHFNTADVLNLFEKRPELRAVNEKYGRNEGFEKALMKDRVSMENQRNSKNISVQERARQRIPGMTQLLSKRPDQFSLGVWPCYFSKARGVEVWDLDGKRYIDMSIGGIGANVLGYADPDVDLAVTEAVKAGTSSSLNCPEEVELADLLCEIHPWAEKVRFARTGGESMAIAVRIARAFTGRDKVAFCGYHGWHDWYLAANIGTENALGEHLMQGLDPAGVPKCLAGTAFPFRYNQLNDLKDITSQHGNDLAAIVMEPIRNDKPVEGFLDGVREIADQLGAVLIVDEISAGFRMNTGGAHMLLDLQPDIAVFSKALGNGYPIGAVIGKGDIMDAAQSTFISSTYWTERIGPTAAIATIRKHQRMNAGEHLVAIGNAMQAGWRRIADKHGVPIHVGGIPPLSHFAFEGEDAAVIKALFIQLMLDKGFLASTSFYSMYAHSEEHVSAYLKAADEVFGELANARKTGCAENMLVGERSTTGFKRLI